jgi:hypothetical protein
MKNRFVVSRTPEMGYYGAIFKIVLSPVEEV